MSVAKRVLTWLGLGTTSVLWAGALRATIAIVILAACAAAVGLGAVFTIKAASGVLAWQIVACVWWAGVLICVVSWRAKRLAIKGYLGEMMVRATLRVWLPSAKRYHDVYMRREDGENRVTQIDHIVVSRRGVFVIETKNWKSRMRGTATDRSWRCYGRRGGSSWEVQSPLKQNDIHVGAVEKVIGDTIAIVPLVALVGWGRLVNGPVPDVTQGFAGLVCSIRERQPMMTSDDVTDIAKRLEAAFLSNSAETRATHDAQLERGRRAIRARAGRPRVAPTRAQHAAADKATASAAAKGELTDEQIDRHAEVLRGRAQYTSRAGKTMPCYMLERSDDSLRYKLCSKDGKNVWWANADRVQIKKEYQSPQSIAEVAAYAKKFRANRNGRAAPQSRR